MRSLGIDVGVREGLDLVLMDERRVPARGALARATRRRSARSSTSSHPDVVAIDSPPRWAATRPLAPDRARARASCNIQSFNTPSEAHGRGNRVLRVDGGGVRGLPRRRTSTASPRTGPGSPKGRAHGGLPARDRGRCWPGCLPPKGVIEARVARARPARAGRAHGRADVDRPAGRRARRADGAAGARRQAIRARRPAGRRDRAPREHPAGQAVSDKRRSVAATTRPRCSTTVRAATRTATRWSAESSRPATTPSARRCSGAALREGRGRDRGARGARMEAAPGDAVDAERPRDARDPRRPGPRGAVRIGERPDLPDVDLRPGRGRPAEALGLRSRREPDARGVPGRARRARGRQRTGSRSRAAWPPRPRCCSRCGPAITWCSPTTSTAGRTGCWRTCSSAWGLDRSHGGPGGRGGARGRRSVRRTKLVWVETPSNPMLKIVDLAAVADDRARSRRARRRRQHVRHAGAAATAGARRRRRRPQRDEVHRRPLRPDRRRDRHERRRVGRAARVPHERRRRGAGADGLLPGAPRAEDARGADARAQRERPRGRGVPRRAPEGHRRPLSGARVASGTRRRGTPDVGLRRHGVVPGRVGRRGARRW